MFGELNERFSESSDTSPLSSWHEYTDIASGDSIDIMTYTSSNVSSTSAGVSVFVEAWKTPNRFGNFAEAGASASMSFSPLVTEMLVSYGISELGFNNVRLTDITNGSVLLWSDGVNDLVHGLPRSYLSSFDLSHIYRISVDTSIIAPAFTSNFFRLQPVPEPTTALLLGLGLMGLAGVRRKFSN